MTLYPIGPLFDTTPPPAKHLARRTDPETSKRAARHVARSGKAVRQRKQLYEAVVAGPGRTCPELAKATGIDRYDAARRLPELKGKIKHGDVKRCEVTGSPCVTWEVAT